MFGRGAADRVVIERAWALESQLRKLEKLGSNPTLLPPSRLRVITTDRRAGVLTNRVLGTYVAAALTHVLRASKGGEPWAHTLILCGAEKLRGDVLDRLIDSCEATSHRPRPDVPHHPAAREGTPGARARGGGLHAARQRRGRPRRGRADRRRADAGGRRAHRQAGRGGGRPGARVVHQHGRTLVAVGRTTGPARPRKRCPTASAGRPPGDRTPRWPPTRERARASSRSSRTSCSSCRPPR